MTKATAALEQDECETEADRYDQERMQESAELAMYKFYKLVCDPRLHGREVEAMWLVLHNADEPFFPLIERFLTSPNPEWRSELEEARKEYEASSVWQPLPIEPRGADAPTSP
jgi:hypothetical protein